MTDEALKTRLVTLLEKFMRECAADNANPYLLLQKLEKDVEWMRHEIAAGMAAKAGKGKVS